MRIITLILFLLLAATTSSGQVRADERPENFDTFFARFTQDAAFAVSRTQFPLQCWLWQYGMDGKGNDESAPEISVISRAQFVQSPSLAHFMTQNGLRKVRQSMVTDNAVVDIGKEGTGWLVSYHFKLQHGCWFLWRYEDKST